MKKVTIVFILSFLCIGLTSKAQEYDYTKAEIKIPVPPSIVLDASIKTYDIKLLVSKKTSFGSLESNADEAVKLLEKEYLIPFAKLQQVDSTGNLHIFVLLQKFVSKGTTATRNSSQQSNGFNFKTDIALRTIISDQYGRQLINKQFIQPEMLTHFDDNWSGKDIKANAELIYKTTIIQAIRNTLVEYESKITGGESSISLNMAYLNDVKKFPELKSLKDQAKELKNSFGSNSNIKAYLNLAKQYVPDWEKMTNFNANKDSNEVKRVAYQNLTTYYILNGNPDKAGIYLKPYKTIDKNTKEMMGLIKYKSSEENEKLMAVLAPETENLVPAEDGTVAVNKAINADLFTYYSVKATITIDDRKNSGTYNGTIKIEYPEPAINQSSIIALDAADAALSIIVDENGKPKLVKSFISKITGMKDSSGKTYQTIKFGSALLGGSQYSLMKELYSSPKITTMKVIIPQGGDFLVKKAGDDKGVKSSMFNAKKNLTAYLQDCPAALQIINSAKYSVNIPMEKLGSAYTTCP